MRAHIKMVLEVFNALDISMSDTYRVEESWKGWQNFVHVVGGKKQRGAQLSSSSSSYFMRQTTYYVCIKPSPKRCIVALYIVFS